MRRFVLCLALCYFVLVFFSPFSIAITFVRFALVWFYLFPLPLGVWEGLRLVFVALPGPQQKDRLGTVNKMFLLVGR